MINRKIQEFVERVITRGRINFGDVRRLQRDCLPSGITNREELEVLISLNAKLLRADKAWAQWLIAIVADFVATREGCGHPIEDAVDKWVERLLEASATNLSRKIARQIRRELARLRAIQSTRADVPHLEGMRSCDVQQSSQAGAPKAISAIVRPEGFLVTQTALWCRQGVPTWPPGAAPRRTLALMARA
jgi:hypothetical protein